MADPESTIPAHSIQDVYAMPPTWQEMNRVLFAIQSGSLSAEAVGGISVAFARSIDIQEQEKKKERELTNEQLLQLASRNRDEAYELGKEILDLINGLARNNEEKRELLGLQALLLQQRQFEADKRKIDSDIETLAKMVHGNKERVQQIIEAGLASPDQAIRNSAAIADARFKTSQKVVTLTYNFGDEPSKRPQHLVYVDANGRMYIKDPNGKQVFVDDLKHNSLAERNAMYADIERQSKSGEAFGNENSQLARDFEKANNDYNQELLKGGQWIVIVDSYIADGRGLRNRLQEVLEKKRQIEEGLQDCNDRIAELDKKYSRTPEDREKYALLKEKQKLLNEKNIQLGLDIQSMKVSATDREHILESMTGGNFTQDTVFNALPDSEFKKNAVEMQTRLLERLKKLEQEEASIAEAKKRSQRSIETARTALSTMEKLSTGFSGFDKNLARGSWVSNMSRDGLRTDYVRDKQGREVFYDKDYGRFFREEIDKTTGKKLQIFYRDPEELVSFFTQAWSGHRFFRNESELKDVTMQKQADFVRAQIGQNTVAETNLNKVLDVQAKLLNDEKNSINQTMAQVMAGGGGSVAPDPNKPAADSIDPIGPSQNRNVFSAAASPQQQASGTGTGIGGPAAEEPGNNENKLRKGVISLTSDANR